MVEQTSPLGSHWLPGRFGAAGAAGVILSECGYGSIVQVAAWPGEGEAAARAIGSATGLILSTAPNSGAVGEEHSAFGFAPGRFLVSANAESLSGGLQNGMGPEIGTVTDLSHGRVAFRAQAERVEWVLSKLVGLDFALSAWAVGAGRASAHHDIGALIQRTGEQAFDIYVLRSFARSFWHTLTRAAEETGYEVA